MAAFKKLFTTTKKQLADIFERAAWTAAEVVVSAVSVDQLGIPKAWIPVAAFLLAAVKSKIAQHFGNGTAATLPSDVEPSPSPE